MITRRRLLTTAGVMSVALAGCGDDAAEGGGGTTQPPDDADGPDIETVDETVEGTLAFSTPAFDDGGTIPERFTGVGADVSPKLVVDSVPEGAESLALVVDDPDAPGYSGDDGFVHWLLWNVPPDVDQIPEDVPQEDTVLQGARQGTNDFDEVGYRGPLPPDGDGPHTYRFTMYGADTILDLESGAERAALEAALDAHVLDSDRITGEFER